MLLLALISPVVANLLVVDLGNAFWKAALVSPGRFDVLTNQQSKRKTFTGLSLGETRAFGDEAVRDFTKRPFTTPANFRWLIGAEDSEVPSERLPAVPYSLSFKNETVTFSDLDLTAEEALAHLLDFAKTLVRESGKSSEGLDLVLTVPAEASLRERQAHVRAGRMAGFRRVSLASEVASAAVQRGVDLAGAKNANETISDRELGLNLILNVGASHTEACVVDFVANTTMAVTVRACASALVGGASLDALLADEMERRFFQKFPALVKDTPTGKPVLDARSKLRLLRQAEATKLQLSANKDASFSVESLFLDRDFRVTVKREEFEALIQPAISDIIAVVTSALSRAGVAIADINTREVVGGAWRVPKLTTALSTAFGAFGQRLNGEEAAVFGAAFLAASNAPSVKLAAKVALIDSIGTRKYSVKISAPDAPSATNTVLFESGAKLGLRRVVRVPAADIFASGKAVVELLENDSVVEVWNLASNSTADIAPSQLVMKFELDVSGLVKLVSTDLTSSTDSANSANSTNSTASSVVASRIRETWEEARVGAGQVKLAAARSRDALVVARLASRNGLEGFVYDRRAKLAEDAIIRRVAAPGDIDRLNVELEKAETWLYSEEGESATQTDFETRLVDLKATGFTAIDHRASELKAREALGPFVTKAVAELTTGIADLNEKRVWVPAAAVDKLAAEFTDFTTEWSTLDAKQKALKDHEDPAYLVADIKKKAGGLVRELRRLLKIPAPILPSANNTTSTTNTNETPANNTTDIPVTNPVNATDSDSGASSGHQPADEL